MALKNRIIEEASKMFFKNGIRSITMSDIANELGISKRTLYEVFKDKEELLTVCINSYFIKNRREVKELISSSEDMISILMRVYTQHLNEAQAVNKSLLRDLKKYHPNLYSKIDDYRQESIVLFFPLFQRGVDLGLIRDTINIDIYSWIIRSQFQMLVEGEMEMTKYSESQFVRAIILVFVRGIATPKGNQMIDDIVAGLKEPNFTN